MTQRPPTRRSDARGAPRQVLPRMIAPVRPRARNTTAFALLLLVPIAFWLGRLSVERASSTATSSAETTRAKTSTSASAAPLIATSTSAMCPCPQPRPKKDPLLSLKRKKVPPSDVKEPEGRDPTLEVARYLREHVRELGECAPAAGGELRVHLEVTVAPGGGIERVRIMNLEPLPSSVSECVEKGVRAFNPPGFDASKAETFALTVVL